MTSINLAIPQVGQPNSTEQPKEANNFTLLSSLLNGNLDTTNITGAFSQSATVNTGGATVKGAVNIAASESRTNTAYGTLTTPDQVTGIVLPINGLIVVWYTATWQSSVSAAGTAAIFLNANQVTVVDHNASNANQSATVATRSTQAAGIASPLTTTTWGLGGPNNTVSYPGDSTTGQIIGTDLNGAGGPCSIFAAAGTYTVSVQFKASSGSVTASNRKLWVQALSFA